MNARGQWQAALAGLFLAIVGGGVFGLLRFSVVDQAGGRADSLFPSLVALGLLALGTLTAVRDMISNGPCEIAEGQLRTCVVITGSVIAFAAIIGPAGLLPAVFVSVVLAAFGAPEVRLRQSIALGLGVSAAIALVFVGLLGLPIKLIAGWP